MKVTVIYKNAQAENDVVVFDGISCAKVRNDLMHIDLFDEDGEPVSEIRLLNVSVDLENG
jgi:hypothetical protein